MAVVLTGHIKRGINTIGTEIYKAVVLVGPGKERVSPRRILALSGLQILLFFRASTPFVVCMIGYQAECQKIRREMPAVHAAVSPIE